MRLPLTLLVAVVAVFLVFPATVEWLTDWLWFGEVGYRPVYLKGFAVRGLIGALVFVVALAWLWVNARPALRSLSSTPFTFTTREGITVALPTRDQLRPLVHLVLAVAAFLQASLAARQWLTVLMWWNRTPFGQADPILGYDAGFYVFTLPVLETVRMLLLGLVLFAAAGVAALYVASGQLALTPFGVRVAAAAERHLTWLAAALFVVLALGAWLSRLGELSAPSGIIQGPGYADVHARIPAALALAGAALVAAAASAYAAVTHKRRALVAGAALYAIVLVGGAAYASILQRFVVSPNEQVREAPYIEYNIAATRTAFALDQADERDLSGDASLTRADIEANRATLDNVRLWDHQPLLETFAQIQQIRTYYDFVSVDNDRYRIGGQLRQVMLSARELNPAALPNRTWVNERLVFTHGHGLTLGPVNQVTSEGLPVLFVRDLPPVSTVDVNVAEPSIYFGELVNDYAIVRTRAQEFHYPKGEDNVYATYAGAGGVPLDSLWRKVLFAVRFRAYQILLSDDITPESRMMFDRQVRRRAQKIAPFLLYDDDPYPVVSDGRIVWIQDAYTATDRYPYSAEGAPGISYLRNSVKAVVDAYDGSVRFYTAEPGDPLVRAVGRAFPTLLRAMDEMPPGLRQHVRYPEGIFQIQASVYATYHMTNPAVFYNKEDQWEAPVVQTGSESQRMVPYYTIMKLPGEREAEFIQMLPFTPRRRDNLASWMVARSDGEHYGKLVVFQFSKQTLVFGPAQIVARINQDQVISPQITLWNQQGSEVIQGTLMVIPIEGSLVYVRPLYLRAQTGRIPELTRVIVAYQNRIVMERTLDEALARIFGEGGRPRPAEPAASPAPAPGAGETAALPSLEWQQLAAQARDTYQRALEAQRAGNWAKYGEEIKRLGEILERLRQR
jgi:hypothetical protein